MRTIAQDILRRHPVTARLLGVRRVLLKNAKRTTILLLNSNLPVSPTTPRREIRAERSQPMNRYRWRTPTTDVLVSHIKLTRGFQNCLRARHNNPISWRVSPALTPFHLLPTKHDDAFLITFFHHNPQRSRTKKNKIHHSNL